MNFTLEQARTLVAFADAGTLQAAARTMHKAHSAVLYALKQLETQSGLSLFNREGYRTRLTAQGEEVLRQCRGLLEAERTLEATCERLKSGWEPTLTIVTDAIMPLAPLLEVIRAIRKQRAPTRVRLAVESLGAVEERFERERADAMITLLPSRLDGVDVRALPRIRARLVAHRSHALAGRAKAVRDDELAAEVLVTVRGSDPRLQLPTAALDRSSAVHLSDFHAKKAAILAGVGFGWLPEWLMEKELKRGELVALHVNRGGAHAFEPRLVMRTPLGRAGKLLLEQVVGAP